MMLKERKSNRKKSKMNALTISDAVQRARNGGRRRRLALAAGVRVEETLEQLTLASCGDGVWVDVVERHRIAIAIVVVVVVVGGGGQSSNVGGGDGHDDIELHLVVDVIVVVDRRGDGGDDDRLLLLGGGGGGDDRVPVATQFELRRVAESIRTRLAARQHL